MIRIFIADDQKLVRQGVCRLLESIHDFQVVGQAADGLQTLELVQHLQPDVLLLDISMPGKSGLEVVRELKEMNLQTRIVVLSMHRKEAYLQQVFKDGVNGYLLKAGPPSHLAEAIRAARCGDFFISPCELGMAMGDSLDWLKNQAVRSGHELLLASA